MMKHLYLTLGYHKMHTRNSATDKKQNIGMEFNSFVRCSFIIIIHHYYIFIIALIYS